MRFLCPAPLAYLLLIPLLTFSACSDDDDPAPTPSATAPTITAFAPTSAAVGATVTLSGTNFTGATTVTFNGLAAASFAVVSGSAVTAVVPVGATTGPISLTTPAGTATTGTAFTVVSAPLTVPCTTITGSITWTDRVPGPGADYLVRCPLVISGTGMLTIEPGVTVLFEGATSGLTTQSGGGLKAVGTAAAPIRFLGANPIAGAWKGLHFSSINPANELTYCFIEHAGGAASSVSTQIGAVQLLLPTTTARIHHTSISNSSGFGIYLRAESFLESFRDNTITTTTQAPFSGTLDHADKLDGSSNLQSSGASYIEVRTGRPHTPANGSTLLRLRRLLLPYRLSGHVTTDAKLTIDPGATLEFEGGAALSNYGYTSTYTGAITAVGTAANRITFRGVQRVKGAWNGIWFATNSIDNRLAFADISDAGGGPIHSFTPLKSNFHIGRGGGTCRGTVENCSLTNGDGYGLASRNVAAVTFSQSNNTFGTPTNTLGDVGTW